MKTELCDIMLNCGSDKGLSWHNYTPFYHDKFQNLKNKKLNIFELGLGTNNVNIPSNMGVNGIPGASLRGWKEYFVESEIFGADIDKDILFNEDRIKTYFCDQTNKESIQEMWNNSDLKNKLFDIIIDDGLHELNANITFFENSFAKLKKDGLYIIEDVGNNKITNYRESLDLLKNKFNFNYDVYSFEHQDNCYDNTLIVIKKINISLVTACKDRNECLKVVLPSWLQHKEIDEIIIVDWSSKESLQNLLKLDDRIKIVRVENEKYYKPAEANNLAVSFASGNNILRIDVDHFLNPYYNFFEIYKINEDNFVSGESETVSDRDNNPYYKYLFGLLYITKNNFNKVNGYNENIGYYYSHEDRDIFERLKLLGLKQIKLKNNHSVIHIPHSDKKRFEYFEGGQNTTTDEYTTVETHIGKNLQLFNNIKSYCVAPLIKWEICSSSNNYFEVKKVINKLQNTPTINCISLEESEDRRLILENQFKEYGINYINFLISKRFIIGNDKIKGKLVHTLNEGTTGCCVSHLKNIKRWLENTNEEIGFFCEDDLSLETVQYWNNNFNELIEEVPKDWDCIQLLTIRSDNIELKARERLWNDWGVTAYILKRDYAQKIINTYFKDDTFILELPEPNASIQPLIENLIFLLGKTYVLPLFIENIKIPSTFVKTDNDVNAATLHKNNHILAANTVLTLWKNSNFSHKSHNVKVVDYFIFFNEKELLELRINLLKDVVDEFIIVEANYTHSGQPKPYICKQIIEDLSLPKEKIRLLEIDLSDKSCGLPNESDLYYDQIYNCKSSIGSRERIQRDFLLTVLNDYTDDTVFIISDCDEIINPKNVEWIASVVRNTPNFICKIPLVALEGRADYRLYIKDTDTPFPYDCSMFFATKRQLLIDPPNNIRGNYKLNHPITYIYQNDYRLEDLGWHFGWMGNKNRVKTKALAYSHYGLTLDNFSYKECYGEKMLDYFDSYEMVEGGAPISGISNVVIKKYPIENLPNIIFSLPRVKDFLLPTTTFNWLYDYSTDVDNPKTNFKAGKYYFDLGHTAPALSFFLRCAERTDDILLAYEALIFGYLCYKEQKIRDETAKSLIMHAVCLIPERPEARWLLSVFYEQKQHWMYSYYHAERGLEHYKDNFEPLKVYKEFPGKYSLLFQKAISGYWWGKNEECKNILLDLYNNYDLNTKYRQSVKDNLKRIGIEIS